MFDGMTRLTKGVGHVAYATTDLDQLVAFYSDVFGASVSERHDGEPRHCFVGIGAGTMLHAFEKPDAVSGPGRPWEHGPIDHFTLEAADLDAFMVIRTRLIERGCAGDAVTDFGSLVSVHFTDPDGLLLELSLWKTDPWKPPFTARPFRGRAGAGDSQPRGR
jgi:catechol 2,3-dioxygenase-like lactoylglutathione lyase family enzyme